MAQHRKWYHTSQELRASTMLEMTEKQVIWAVRIFLLILATASVLTIMTMTGCSTLQTSDCTRDTMHRWHCQGKD